MTRRQSENTRNWWKFFNAAARDPNLSDGSARVLSALLSYANGPTTDPVLGSARPGVERLMADTGKTRRTVQRALRDLEDAGWISITRMGGINGDGRNATIYQLHLPKKCIDGIRGASDDPPGASSINAQGCHDDRPTDSLPSHTQAQNNALSKLSEAFPLDVIRAIQDAASGDDGRYPDNYLLHLLAFHHGEDLADFAACCWTIPKSAARRYVAVGRYKTLLNMAAAQGVAILPKGEELA